MGEKVRTAPDTDGETRANARTFSRTPVQAVDLLGAVKTIPRRDREAVHTIQPTWTTSQTYLQWARRGFSHSDDYGYSNAVRYAKLAVTRRIDVLLTNNHVPPSRYRTYPDRMEALGRLGVSAPPIVHELAIDPRNEAEHQYGIPSPDDARRAVEVAELFVSATEPAHDRGSIVMVHRNALGGWLFSKGTDTFTFDGFSNHPMFFMDVLASHPTAKIVIPKNSEILESDMSSWRTEELEMMAIWLNGSDDERSHSYGRISLEALALFKTATGI